MYKKQKPTLPKKRLSIFLSIIMEFGFGDLLFNIRGKINRFRNRHISYANLAHNSKKSNLVEDTVEQIPTIYVHGFRGGEYTTKKMVNEAVKKTKAVGYLRVTIDLLGNILYEGEWTDQKNPIIQLIFKDRWVGTQGITRFLSLVLPELSKRFGFTRYNAVGHSLGATSLVRTELKNYRNRSFPTLNKLVLVAGPFDGVVYLGDLPNINYLTRRGRPFLMNPRYMSMLRRRKRFPKSAAVLNIYGNIQDETNTDKFISVVSAKSIRYILAPIVRDFREIEIRGSHAEHSKMHDDSDVIEIINSFLY